MNLLKILFDSSAFMPHGHCYLWRPGVLWLNTISDGLVALAYATIPMALLAVIRRRKDLPFSGMFALFGTFIFACGATHVMGVVTIWWPMYWLDGAIKAVTAVASVATAALLWPLIPKIVALPSPAKLAELNAELGAANRMLQKRMGMREALAAFSVFALQCHNEADLLAEAQKLAGGIAAGAQLAMSGPPAKTGTAVAISGKGQRFGEIILPAGAGDVSAEALQYLGMVAVVVGIAIERHRAEESLARNEGAMRLLSEQLKESNRDLAEFASVASHDLQEPLRKIQAFGAQLAEEFAPKLDGDGLFYLERMTDASRRMRRLIDDLLQFSQITTDKSKVTSIDLGAVTREVLDDLQPRIDETGAVIAVDLPATVAAEPLQMRRLLQNLLGNALKFRRPNTRPHVRVVSKVLGNSVELTVADDGIGFGPEQAEDIFTVFRRLHGRGDFEGSGMGLAICRKIATQCGGSIVATGVPGQGATFTVTLPRFRET